MKIRRISNVFSFFENLDSMKMVKNTAFNVLNAAFDIRRLLHFDCGLYVYLAQYDIVHRKQVVGEFLNNRL